MDDPPAPDDEGHLSDGGDIDEGVGVVLRAGAKPVVAGEGRARLL